MRIDVGRDNSSNKNEKRTQDGWIMCVIGYERDGCKRRDDG